MQSEKNLCALHTFFHLQIFKAFLFFPYWGRFYNRFRLTHSQSIQNASIYLFQKRMLHSNYVVILKWRKRWRLSIQLWPVLQIHHYYMHLCSNHYHAICLFSLYVLLNELSALCADRGWNSTDFNYWSV